MNSNRLLLSFVFSMSVSLGLSQRTFIHCGSLMDGKSKEILSQMKMVAEGVGTTAALLDLATEANVELPITEQVNAILHEGKSPGDAIRDVMERPSKRE